jgi:hypothetical protein
MNSEAGDRDLDHINNPAQATLSGNASCHTSHRARGQSTRTLEAEDNTPDVQRLRQGNQDENAAVTAPTRLLLRAPRNSELPDGTSRSVQFSTRISANFGPFSAGRNTRQNICARSRETETFIKAANWWRTKKSEGPGVSVETQINIWAKNPSIVGGDLGAIPTTLSRTLQPGFAEETSNTSRSTNRKGVEIETSRIVRRKPNSVEHVTRVSWDSFEPFIVIGMFNEGERFAKERLVRIKHPSRLFWQLWWHIVRLRGLRYVFSLKDVKGFKVYKVSTFKKSTAIKASH